MDQKVTNEPRPTLESTPVQNSDIRPRPRLSLILGARNDEFMGNFKWRLETTLNYLGYNLRRLDRLGDVEVVITDWGSKVPLHTVLSLNSAAMQIVRFILVRPALASELQGDSEFPIVLAQNAAVRRSRGEYIAQIDSDILLTSNFLERLFDVLEARQAIDAPFDRSLLASKRRQVPWQYVIRCPNIQELDWFVRRFGRFFLVERMFSVKDLGLYTGTGFVMMHRTLWQDCQGYDEQLVHWGWMDIDLALRITSKYLWAFLQMFGFPEVFHLEHYSLGTRVVARKCNPMIHKNVFRPNDDEWGLKTYPLQEFVYSSAKDEFDAMSSGNLHPVRANCGLLFIKAQVITAGVWHGLKQAAVCRLQKHIPKRVASFLSIWRRRLVVVSGQLKGQPVTRWPSLLKNLWIEHQRR